MRKSVCLFVLLSHQNRATELSETLMTLLQIKVKKRNSLVNLMSPKLVLYQLVNVQKGATFVDSVISGTVNETVQYQSPEIYYYKSYKKPQLPRFIYKNRKHIMLTNGLDGQRAYFHARAFNLKITTYNVHMWYLY